MSTRGFQEVAMTGRLCGVVLLGALFAAPAYAQGDAKLGQKLYVEQKCGMCHSIAGKGNAKGPLDDVGSRLSADEIRQWIVDAPAMTAKAKATRKPFMKAYSTLTKEQVDALVAYLQTLKK
jgi:mono/diheme cytochrome c family protein